jgi:hypothetical protein
MTIEEHITEFVGKRVVDWEPGDPVPDPKDAIPRVSLQWDESEQGKRWTDNLGALLADPASRELTGILIGPWGEVATGEATAEVVVEALVAARDQLPNLKAIFLGDITYEESEISWIEQTDVSPLLTAYPDLEHLTVRGGNNLSLGPLQHDRLKSLVVQTGGLPREIVHQVNKAQLPELEHLELWLGDSGYGADATVEDLEPILSGNLFPNLKYLGLRDSEIADEVAKAAAGAPILERIEVLDLSLGTLTDDGARALLESGAVRKLKKLDLHHHYCSDEMVRQLEALPLEVDASEQQEPDEYDGEVYRSVAVAE